MQIKEFSERTVGNIAIWKNLFFYVNSQDLLLCIYMVKSMKMFCRVLKK